MEHGCGEGQPRNIRGARIGSPKDFGRAPWIAFEKNYHVRLEQGIFSHRRDERKPAI